ncbi:hypothetical protein B0H10DRAFT_537053 [Mycena sp. CBHHK59/15]|nr:hypothetical protein B0H10DRAFT_537053 [Mycena sp. CBHHK59/15]
MSSTPEAPPACSVSSGMTFVINTQGPGPFTFNINLTGASPVENFTFTVDTGRTETHVRTSGSLSSISTPAPREAVIGSGGSARRTRQPRRQFLIPRDQPRRSESEVPETPQSTEDSPVPPRRRTGTQLPHVITDAADIQAVELPQSPQSQLAELDDTEDTDTHTPETQVRLNTEEPTATFSPNCQLVTPSRKRRLERMDSDESSQGDRRCRKLEILKAERS